MLLGVQREALEKYLLTHGKSPKTGKPVPKDTKLVPNRKVADAIDQAAREFAPSPGPTPSATPRAMD